jgi:hypothetical protein
MANRFHVWAINTADESIELLSGTPAGERHPDGSFPESTVNACVAKRLREFAKSMKEFAPAPSGDGRGQSFVKCQFAVVAIAHYLYVLTRFGEALLEFGGIQVTLGGKDEAFCLSERRVADRRRRVVRANDLAFENIGEFGRSFHPQFANDHLCARA